MAFWHTIMFFIFKKHLFYTLPMFCMSSILFSSGDMLQNNSEETMEPAGPLNQSPGPASTRARCGSRDADYVCLVYKCSSEQIPHFLALVPPRSRIYIHRLSFWHKLQTKSISVLSYKRTCLLEYVARGHSLWHRCSGGEGYVSLLISLVYSGEKNMAEISVTVKSMGIVPQVSYCSERMEEDLIMTGKVKLRLSRIFSFITTRIQISSHTYLFSIHGCPYVFTL